MPKLVLALFVLVSFSSHAQDVVAEFDKDRDFTKYKTFTIGEFEIITPKDQRTVPDAQLHEWVQMAIKTELTEKGLTVLMLERGRNHEHVKDYASANKDPWEFPHGGKASLQYKKDNPVI
jgi:hypothetical protein